MTTLTEVEARKIWCPFARLLAGNNGSASTTMIGAPAGYNRSTQGGVEGGAVSCIASKCMAWRWEPVHTPDSDINAISSLGFCGLAGKP